MTNGYLSNTLLAVITTGTQQNIFQIGNCLIYQEKPNIQCILRLARSKKNKWNELEKYLKSEDGTLVYAEQQENKLAYGLCNAPPVLYTEHTDPAKHITKIKKQYALLQPSTNPLKDITQHLTDEEHQFGFARNGTITVIYSPHTRIDHPELIPPSYYNNIICPFSKKKNEENNKTYEKLVKALKEGNAENIVNEYLEKYL